ncbi:MAG: App1 family protein [Gemmatimonadaceae bacterium]
MSGILGALARQLLVGVETTVGRLRQAVPPSSAVADARIAAYDGYGTSGSVTVLGRALRNSPPPAARAEAGLWENFVATYRRFETDEIPGAVVRVGLGGVEREAVADSEGHFDCRLELDRPLPDDRRWHEVDYTLVSPRPAAGDGRSRARVYVPAATAGFGIISDVDDTVVRTDVRQILRMLRTIVFGNARTRLPFPGVAAFYRALEAGFAGSGPNPLFYVSSSPWNLYELLVELFELQGIPRGPLLLRDWGVQAGELPNRNGSHKQSAIRRILAEYPALPFILVGDSGQEDPEIYASIVRDHPRRIRAIYIRDVTLSPTRTAAIGELAAEVQRADSVLVLTPDTVGAARDAAERGWIDPAALPEIAGEAREDDPDGDSASAARAVT